MAQWRPGKKVEFVEDSLSAIQEADKFKGKGIPEPRRGRYTYACPRCGIHTLGGKEYCTKCGFHLNATCPHCGMEWRYALQYTFCAECGGALGSGEEFNAQRPQRGAAGLALKKKETPKEGEGS